MEHNVKNQLTEIYTELEKFTQTLNIFREFFSISIIPGSKTTAEELKLINVLMKYDVSVLTFVVNEIEYTYQRYGHDTKLLNYIGILPLITIFSLIGIFLLHSPPKLSTHTVYGLWIIFILSGAFFLRKIFILPSIFKANRCLLLIKQAVALKEKLTLDH